MLKLLFLATILLLANTTCFGQLSVEDYSVYAAIIKTEIKDSTKSVAVLKNSIDNAEKNENTYITANQLASNSLRDKYQVYGWTENNKKERPSVIDSNYALLISDYCRSNIDKFALANNFNQTFKTVLIKKLPIKRNSIQKGWDTFYKNYPGSGEIFSFSKIKFYTADTTAIVYYWIRRNSLNGHGALAILTRKNGQWQMENKIYLWNN